MSWRTPKLNGFDGFAVGADAHDPFKLCWGCSGCYPVGGANRDVFARVGVTLYSHGLAMHCYDLPDFVLGFGYEREFHDFLPYGLRGWAGSHEGSPCCA